MERLELKFLALRGLPDGDIEQFAKSPAHALGCGAFARGRTILRIFTSSTVLVTASADALDSRTGHIADQPVLSAAIPGSMVARINFALLDPSDTVESFQHRGDFKGSRKAEAFQPITPLTPADNWAGLPSEERARRRVENKFIPIVRKHQRAELVAPPCIL